MSLNNWSRDLTVVVAWIQSDCLKIKQFKCVIKQIKVLVKNRRRKGMWKQEIKYSRKTEGLNVITWHMQICESRSLPNLHWNMSPFLQALYNDRYFQALCWLICGFNVTGAFVRRESQTHNNFNGVCIQMPAHWRTNADWLLLIRKYFETQRKTCIFPRRK